MLEALRVETARVRMTLVRYDDAGTAQPVAVDPARAKFLPPPNEFVYLRTSITNLSRELSHMRQHIHYVPSDRSSPASELVLSLNLDLSPEPHVIHQGELADVPVGRLAKGESFEVETPVTFIACGRFDFSAEVYALGRPHHCNLVGHGKMLVDVSGET